MKRCLPSGKSKDSSRVSTSVQGRPLLALNSTSKSQPLRASCLRSWSTGLTLRACTCNNMQLRRLTPTNVQNQVCRLFALTSGAVTEDMSVMASEKLKNTT